MSSPSVNTPFSDMRQTQFHSSFESASTLPSTLELPKPVLSNFSRASLEKVRRDTLLKFCEARPGVPPRTCELSDALAFLRAIRHQPTSPTSSSSNESQISVSPRGPHVAPRTKHDTVSAGRIIEWRRTLELSPGTEISSNANGPWHSFLPSFGSTSTSSSVSSQYESCEPSANARTENEPPSWRWPSNHYDLHLCNHQEADVSEAGDEEEDMWPYDGKGLYEHHPKNDCGRACFASCQLRRKFRPQVAGLARFVSRFRGGKFSGKPRMKNSDVPHPPWKLKYCSNDDSLEEDQDDGDLEVWLESITERQKVDHKLWYGLYLDGRPDSRIFS
ncbi:hypothetical protein FRC12_001860 [Ceratobasidium sp. 428]|nr:hypothetical protein FRC12_001860 [Ceratobasidium sp. 428]